MVACDRQAAQTAIGGVGASAGDTLVSPLPGSDALWPRSSWEYRVVRLLLVPPPTVAPCSFPPSAWVLEVCLSANLCGPRPAHPAGP